jgi:ribonuclease HI
MGHPAIEYFTDGSRFVQDGMRFTGYAIVTLDSVIEACQLLDGTSAKKAELFALTQALQLAAGVWVNTYIDSKYAFTTMRLYIKKEASFGRRKY